jgi:hypothetical protein
MDRANIERGLYGLTQIRPALIRLIRVIRVLFPLPYDRVVDGYEFVCGGLRLKPRKGRPAGRLAKFCAPRAIPEQEADCLGQSLAVSRRHHPPVNAVAYDFRKRTAAGHDAGRAGRHRLDQRDTQPFVQ